MATTIEQFETVLANELAWIHERRAEYWNRLNAEANSFPVANIAEAQASQQASLDNESPHATDAQVDVNRLSQSSAANAIDDVPRDQASTDNRSSPRDDLVGLAFSGGGIRSSTLAVGFLQGLAKLRLLGLFDYLSSVSGGGYAAAWLTAWIHRQRDLVDVQRQLDPNRVEQSRVDRSPLPRFTVVNEEPEPIHHVRSYSRYLSPYVGFLSADTWTLVAIYLRNTIINLSILITFFGTFILLSHLLVWWFALPGMAGDANAFRRVQICNYLCIGLALWTAIIMMIYRARIAETPKASQGQPPSTTECTRSTFFWSLMLPLIVLSILMTWTYAPDPSLPSNSHFTDWPQRHPKNAWHMAVFTDRPAWLEYPMFAAVFCLPVAIFGFIRRRYSGYSLTINVRLLLSTIVLIMSISFGLLAAIGYVIPWLAVNAGTLGVLTVGPPAIVLSFYVACTIEVMLLSRIQSEYEFEWRNRLNADLLRFAFAWLAFFGVIFYLQRAFVALGNEHYIKPTAIVGWLITTLGGLIAGQRQPKQAASEMPGVFRRIILVVAPPVFLIGLLWLLSEAIVHVLPAEPIDQFWCFVGCLALFVVLTRIVDINRFSLHALYANRLTRCYLGASRSKSMTLVREAGGGLISGAPTGVDDVRRDNQLTGFDNDDDLPLAEVYAKGLTRVMRCRGPYPIINTALQLVGGTDLANQDRLAASFFLSPLYCGSNQTGFVPTPHDDSAAGKLTLGRATAISGAAIDPNMPIYHTPALTALLTIFNARIGCWLRNPAIGSPGSYDARGPWLSFLLVRELLGQTNKNESFIRLSDGGHFENLGAYELIRRRCRFIVVCDFAEDPSDASENLARLMRFVRIDFGIEIEIDTSPIHKDENGVSKQHAVVGAIRYQDRFPGKGQGTLVFVRSSMTGDEPADVLQYARTHEMFPHQGTMNQFFSADQFEAYRALGQHMAERVFGSAAATVSDERAHDDKSHWQQVDRLFAELSKGDR
jgi:hypothetical protein